MELGVVDVKVIDKANGSSDGATINTSSKEGCVLVCFRI